MRARLGEWMVRWRWQVLLAWLAGTAALWLLVPGPPAGAGLTSDLLPADSPCRVGLEEMRARFGEKAGLSHAVIVFERAGGALSREDRRYIETVAAQAARPREGGASARDLRDVQVLSPGSLPPLGNSNPLISPDEQAAMVDVSLPYNFATTPAVRVVEGIHATLAASPPPAGLTASVTGSAGYGRDHLLANERSHDKILLVTIGAVIAILLAVYRAPLAALVPLVAIALASLAATRLTVLGKPLGLSSGTAERLFMLVLLYGAGVDYSLLFLSRCRELLDENRPPAQALARGLEASLAAIVPSAAVTAAGLATLAFARFGVFRDVGPVIVLALLVALAAAITLVPALAAIVGPRMFWPARRGASPAPRSPRVTRFWPAVAALVMRRPGLVLAVTLAALLLPARRAARIDWSYDAQASLTDSYHAVRGMAAVTRHWSVGQLAPVTVLVSSVKPLSPATWKSAARKVVEALHGIAGVAGVRCLDNPLGRPLDAVTETLLMLAADRVQGQFLSPDGRALRLDVTLAAPPQTPAAMRTAEIIGPTTRQTLALAGVDARVYLTGPTAETADLRDLTRSDFLRTAALALGVILVIVAVLLRDVWLSLFMVAATALGYAATLGVTAWVFAAGAGGMDWEVQVFLFIVMVAVGQDYNLFLAVRLAQESQSLPRLPATRQALVATGPVISSCGLIMAATLGSLMVGDVRMLRQLGFALALGMLIDTFLVRPLLLPAFILLARRTLKNVPAFLR